MEALCTYVLSLFRGRMLSRSAVAAAFAVTLAACSATTNAPPLRPQTNIAAMTAPQQEAALRSGDLDREVAALYNIRPQLSLPARIALVKTEHGKVSTPTQTELSEWMSLSERLGPSFGEFVALNPMIAQSATELAGGASDLTGDIRRGSALLKADYALVYEIAANADSRTNALSITDWTIVGLWLSPSRSVDGQAVAEAVLIDVRTGLPLGTASAQADSERLARATTAHEQRKIAAEAAGRDAVIRLVGEVEDLAETLIKQAAADTASIAD